MTEKMWGSEPFWGLGYEWDPDWVFAELLLPLREDPIGVPLISQSPERFRTPHLLGHPTSRVGVLRRRFERPS